jgi:phosphate acetyltransferase
VQQLAQAQAIGPMLQGFAKPISDLSRGASVEEIVATAVVTLARAQS